jgi:hypothetical protein
MNKSIFVIATALIGALSLQAQDSESLRPDLGFKVGIPVADMFNPGTGFSSHTPRYTFGVTGEFHLPKNLRFEIDGCISAADQQRLALAGGRSRLPPDHVKLVGNSGPV